MNKELAEKMDGLLTRIAREDKRAASSFAVSIICRVFLTLLCAGSLTYTILTFSAMATPRNLAIVVNEKIRDSIPSLRTELQAELPEQAKVLAKNTLGLMHHIIPLTGDLAKTQLELRFNQVMEHYQVQREKILEDICSRVLDKIAQDKDIVKNRTLGEVLAVQLADECDREIRKIINQEFFAEIDRLQVQVEQLRSTPEKIMTRSQAAKKQLITCWIYLVDNKNIEEEGLIGNTASFLTRAAESFLSAKN
ncbi:MAG: hypothetical protein PHH77_06290 [Victivallaceae bacterium]|nr:hypothetical protein [Victivallaceae bacterium]